MQYTVSAHQNYTMHYQPTHNFDPPPCLLPPPPPPLPPLPTSTTAFVLTISTAVDSELFVAMASIARAKIGDELTTSILCAPTFSWHACTVPIVSSTHSLLNAVSGGRAVGRDTRMGDSADAVGNDVHSVQ